MITNTTGSDWFRYLLIWALFPFLNFLLWNYIGSNQSFLSSPPAPSSQFSCPPIPRTNINLPPIESGPLKFNYSYCQRYQSFSRSVSSSLSQPILPLDYSLSVTHLDPQKFEQFKGNELAHLKSPAPVSIISRPNDQCSQYAEVPSSTKLSVKSCVGIAWSSTIQQSQYLQRFNSDTKKTGRVLDVTTPKTSGIFRNVAKKRGRMALSEKLYPLFNHLDPIEKFWSKLLAARGIFPGHDIVLMVVNDGEIDLFLNFACSCRHHGISLHNVMVICASA